MNSHGRLCLQYLKTQNIYLLLKKYFCSVLFLVSLTPGFAAFTVTIAAPLEAMTAPAAATRMNQAPQQETTQQVGTANTSNLTAAQVNVSNESMTMNNVSQDMLKAYQREYSFLLSQKESLDRQSKTNQEYLEAKARRMQLQINEKQKELARITATTDAALENLSQLEKRKKEQNRLETVLSATNKRLRKSLDEAQMALRFEKPSDKKINISDLSAVSIADVSILIDEALHTLERMATIENQPGTFQDPEGRLVEGRFIRFGHYAAIGLDGEKSYILAPQGVGPLKAIETLPAQWNPWQQLSVKTTSVTQEALSPNSSAHQKTTTSHQNSTVSILSDLSDKLISLYIFNSPTEVAQVRKAAGLWERMADFAPALFLLAMGLLVAALFGFMARQ